MPANNTEPNKVKYGLKNVHYAVYDEVQNSYGTPKPIKGAVNLSLEQQGEISKFRADNIDYYVSSSNNGYEGDLECALIPDDFMVDVMGEVVDATTGLQYEKSDAKPKAFALLFEFDGDKKAVRHVMYNCKATRPSVAGKTTENTIEPQTETLSISAASREDGIVKAKCKQGETSYADFFKSVVVPTVAA